MNKLYMMFFSLLCLILSTSMTRVNSIEGFTHSSSQFGLKSEVESSKDVQPLLGKGIRPPKPKPPKKGTAKAPQNKENPKGGHDSNARESNREKHEKADGRRQREQAKAEEKKENSKKKR